MSPPNSYDDECGYVTAQAFEAVVKSLAAARIDHDVAQTTGIQRVVVATRVGTDHWVEITPHGDDCYLTCGFRGSDADPDDATVLAAGPLADVVGVAAAWLGSNVGGIGGWIKARTPSDAVGVRPMSPVSPSEPAGGMGGPSTDGS